MMADTITREHRSWTMSRIRGRDTKPEVKLRSMLHRAGFRFRLHDRKLPGRPDIVMPKHRTAIMLHGCFWHRHDNCRNATMPSTRTEFWRSKFEGNVERDRQAVGQLNALGWRVITVWECELKKDPDQVLSSIRAQVEGSI